MGWEQKMVNPLPRTNVRCFIFTSLNRGGESPTENRGSAVYRGQSFYRGLSRGKRGSIIKVCLYARGAVKNWLVNKNVGVLRIVASLGLNLSTANDQRQKSMSMQENIVKPKTEAIDRLPILLNIVKKNALDVGQRMIYKLLMSNHYGQEVNTNG